MRIRRQPEVRQSCLPFVDIGRRLVGGVYAVDRVPLTLDATVDASPYTAVTDTGGDSGDDAVGVAASRRDPSAAIDADAWRTRRPSSADGGGGGRRRTAVHDGESVVRASTTLPSDRNVDMVVGGHRVAFGVSDSSVVGARLSGSNSTFFQMSFHFDFSQLCPRPTCHFRTSHSTQNRSFRRRVRL